MRSPVSLSNRCSLLTRFALRASGASFTSAACASSSCSTRRSTITSWPVLRSNSGTISVARFGLVTRARFAACLSALPPRSAARSAATLIFASIIVAAASTCAGVPASLTILKPSSSVCSVTLMRAPG